ncbi:MAG: UvrD-helicase domain-containing protein, partial [Candidatus Omnitrophica bacterium]|nr:UvrD-helicase domain-containing protein [Candidatus Omnitrophota bacterium]
MKNPQSYRISFPEVYIVEASAGSGKTYELARRYIQLLINPSEHAGEIALKNILAITFTNKAAREMKERILELLKKIALNGFVSEQEKNDIFESLGVSEALACLKSREILQIMMRSFNYFQVQTIDSFINIILSGCALDLKLSANFRIKDAYRDYLKYGFDECVDGVKNNKNILKIFEGFLKQYIYVENKNSWFAKKDILDIIEALFYDLTVYAGGFKKSEVTFSEILKQKSLTYGLIAMFFKKCPKDGLHKKFLQSLERFLAENEENFDLKELGTYFEKDELALTKGALKPAGAILKLWQQIRENLVQIAEKEAMSLFNCYIDIFELVYAEFKKFSIKDDVLFLSELNQQAKILFDSDNINVPELYYRLALRLKHYLIDEFQDTSKLQWHNLSLLINEALSGKGSLFYVGDKKQAIYRFRGGEVRLFDDLKRVYSGFDPKIVTLHKNFRSQKQIVEFNNHIFSKENLTRFINAQQPDSQKSERYFGYNRSP